MYLMNENNISTTRGSMSLLGLNRLDLSFFFFFYVLSLLEVYIKVTIMGGCFGVEFQLGSTSFGNWHEIPYIME